MGLFAKLASLCFGNEAGSGDAGLNQKSCRLPLGATPTPEGVHFSVYSRTAKGIDVCLFDLKTGLRETRRVSMTCDENDVWHASIAGAQPGTPYGYRASGPWKPEDGLWFNERKLLLDPYAKATIGEHDWKPHLQNKNEADEPDTKDNGAEALKSVVVDDSFDWGDESKPLVPWRDTVIYELHSRGFTKLHPEIPDDLRGTYAGLGHPASVSYLKDLGVTAVQLMPVHLHLDDGFLVQRGMANYWGYNTIGFFAPHPEYAAARDPLAQVNEFKSMVRGELHRAGIEVILDVVYNHTGEGDESGLSLFLRGLDNPGYYLLNGDARVMNYTGCGNTVNAASPPMLRLIMDSLRYWAEEMHVDGFRFDLAATLGRRGDKFDYGAPFFQALVQDPVLRTVKLIAEPWDMGPEGYQVGGFPKPWHELNGRYRDTMRRFWKGDDNTVSEMAKRLCGSQDIFGPAGRPPHTSVNFLTSHDGFPLRDVFSYNEKHNEANGENNRDGDPDNHSWNCGEEGETDDAEINAMRRKLARSCLATSFCSLGVPFLTAGDERWRTQQGNNNGYCQDSEISWMNWKRSADSDSMLEFTKRLIRFRNEHGALRRGSYFTGKINLETGRADVAWLNAEGGPLTSEQWHAQDTHFFAAAIDEPATRSVMLLIFNNSAEDVVFPMPPGKWALAFDTALEPSFPSSMTAISKVFTSSARSMACLLLNKA